MCEPTAQEKRYKVILDQMFEIGGRFQKVMQDIVEDEDICVFHKLSLIATFTRMGVLFNSTVEALTEDLKKTMGEEAFEAYRKNKEADSLQEVVKDINFDALDTSLD